MTDTNMKYSLPGIMRYLQEQFTAMERNRIVNDLEINSLQSKILELEGHRNALKIMNKKLLTKLQILEGAIGKEYDADSETKHSGDLCLPDLDDMGIKKFVESKNFLTTATCEILHLLDSPKMEHSNCLTEHPRLTFKGKQDLKTIFNQQISGLKHVKVLGHLVLLLASHDSKSIFQIWDYTTSELKVTLPIVDEVVDIFAHSEYALIVGESQTTVFQNYSLVNIFPNLNVIDLFNEKVLLQSDGCTSVVEIRQILEEGAREGVDIPTFSGLRQAQFLNNNELIIPDRERDLVLYDFSNGDQRVVSSVLPFGWSNHGALVVVNQLVVLRSTPSELLYFHTGVSTQAKQTSIPGLILFAVNEHHKVVAVTSDYKLLQYQYLRELDRLELISSYSSTPVKLDPGSRLIYSEDAIFISNKSQGTLTVMLV
ncbi:BA75_04387T0 [Komagataella pastoris]|uniref:BA75_04387T0 n=1 Tax=Komagataella pastoris TaxID=4922 RepID=A0A1B2JHZ2_PICPA|nr:BA75_04387T0 [Komagataella pastoris]